MYKMNRAALILILINSALLSTSLSPVFYAEVSVETYSEESISSSSYNATVTRISTSGSVHIFTPNASTAIIEAEQREVEVIVHNQESYLKQWYPFFAFSIAFIAAVALIIIRRKTR